MLTYLVLCGVTTKIIENPKGENGTEIAALIIRAPAIAFALF